MADSRLPNLDSRVDILVSKGVKLAGVVGEGDIGGEVSKDDEGLEERTAVAIGKFTVAPNEVATPETTP